MINPQSIRKGILIKFNNKVVDKSTIIEFSKEWNERQENIFKKFLKQGGTFKINNINIDIKPLEKNFNSRGELPITLPPSDPLSRF